MRRLLILLGLVALVGAGSYFLYYHRAMAAVAGETAGSDGELDWLKREFALDAAQYEKVAALHRAYRPVCADHCDRYVAAHHRLVELLQAGVWSPDVGAAFAEQARIQAECHASMLKHAYAVAACMSPEPGRRYLEMVKLQLLEGDPAGMFAAAR